MVRLIFKLRIARVAGANHLAVSFDDPGLEKARQAAQAAAPVPVNKAALEYIYRAQLKTRSLPDIPFHRLWQPADMWPGGTECGQEGPKR